MRLYVNVPAVNVRSMPTLKGKILRLARKGEAIDVTDKAIQSDGYLWREIADVYPVQYIAERPVEAGDSFLIDVRVAPSPDKPHQMPKVRVTGRNFLLLGRPYKFTGANMRALAFYGTGANGIKHATQEHVEQQLQGAREAGMGVVRFWGCHHEVASTSTAVLVEQTLNRLQEYGMRGIVVLDDSIGDSPFRIGSEWHAKGTPMGHMHKDFYKNHSAQVRDWWGRVEPIVQRVADHPALLSFEIMNEPAIHPQPATADDASAFLKFTTMAVSRIKFVNPQALVGIGLINTRQVAPTGYDQKTWFRRLHKETKLDYANVHFYLRANGEAPEMASCLVDAEAAQSCYMPLVIGEIGVENLNPDSLATLLYTFKNHASGFMQWGFSATNRDIGDGDTSGMMAYHGSWHGFVNTWLRFKFEL